MDPTFAAIPARAKSSALGKLIEIFSADWNALMTVFLPFCAGYFLSYFFRTINAVLATTLTKDLGLSASALGLMTAVYFLTFAIIQLPLGILLDRFGPRRVQSAMLLVTAAGAMMFASGSRLEILIVGRALIGLGAAGALIGGLKAIVLCFPKERVPLFNGYFIMLGTLGAVAATLPADWLLTYLSWRSLLALAGAATAVVAALTFTFAPEFPLLAPKKPHLRFLGLGGVYRDLRFWRVAPVSTLCISSAWAIQGLWAERWLADVDGLNRASVVRHLFVMALALSTTALMLGIIADWLRHWRIQPQMILGAAALVFVSAESVLILDIPSLSYLLWALVAGMGAGTVLSYSILQRSTQCLSHRRRVCSAGIHRLDHRPMASEWRALSRDRLQDVVHIAHCVSVNRYRLVLAPRPEAASLGAETIAIATYAVRHPTVGAMTRYPQLSAAPFKDSWR